MKRAFIGLAVALCLGLLGLTLTRVADRGRFARPFSSYGAGEQGTRGLYVLLAELGVPTLRWSRDLDGLPAHATLVALGSCESATARSLSRFERDELIRWLERGGVLVVAGARNYLPESLGVGFADDALCDVIHGTPKQETPDLFSLKRRTLPSNDEASWAVPLQPALAGLPIIPFRAPGELHVAERVITESLFGIPPALPAQSAELEPLALTFERGQGRVIVLGSANMLQNAELDSSDGAAMFVRLLGAYAHPKLVIFDEYHLGLGERRSLMQYLRSLGVMPLLCQLLAVAFVLLRRKGARLGPPRQEPQPLAAREPEASVLAALGHLYARVGDRAAAVRLIARAALLRIAAQSALPQRRVSALALELEQRGATDSARAVREIVALAAGSEPPLPLAESVARIDAALAVAIRRA